MSNGTRKTTSRSVPHFLRVTRALAFVSGAGAPAAAMLVASTDCGGAEFTETSNCDACSSDAVASSDTFAPEVMVPYDGNPVGVSPLPDGAARDAAKDAPNDGATPIPHDGASEAFLPGVVIPLDAAYDGRPMGVVPLPADGASDVVSFPGILIPPDASLLDGGGPLLPPELPA